MHCWGSGGAPNQGNATTRVPSVPAPWVGGGCHGHPPGIAPLFNYSSCPNSILWGAPAPHPGCANPISLTSPRGSPKSPPRGRHPTAGGSRPWHRGVTPVTGGPAAARWVPAGKGWPPARGLSGVGTGPVGGRGDWRGADITAGGSGAVGAGRTEPLRTGASGKWRLGVGKGGVPGGFGEQGGWLCMLAASPPFPGPSCCGCSGSGLFVV